MSFEQIGDKLKVEVPITFKGGVETTLCSIAVALNRRVATGAITAEEKSAILSELRTLVEESWPTEEDFSQVKTGTKLDIIGRIKQANRWFDQLPEGKRFLYFMAYIAIPMSILLAIKSMVGLGIIALVAGCRLMGSK